MRVIKAGLVVLTAIFMAYHTQIFIARIEPNLAFSWLASCLIEGFIIVLALSKRTPIRYLLITLLFCISVISASASFLVKNENLLDTFFTQKRVIQQLQDDLSQTRKAYSYGEKYVTKTLQRERQVMDELREVLRGQKGDIALVNALIFFMFVLVIQATSVYVATTLKQGFETGNETPFETPNETESETLNETVIETPVETAKVKRYKVKRSRQRIDLEQVKRLKEQGKSYREIARELGIPVSKVYRLLK